MEILVYGPVWSFQEAKQSPASQQERRPSTTFTRKQRAVQNNTDGGRRPPLSHFSFGAFGAQEMILSSSSFEVTASRPVFLHGEISTIFACGHGPWKPDPNILSELLRRETPSRNRSSQHSWNSRCKIMLRGISFSSVEPYPRDPTHLRNPESKDD